MRWACRYGEAMGNVGSLVAVSSVCSGARWSGVVTGGTISPRGLPRGVVIFGLHGPLHDRGNNEPTQFVMWGPALAWRTILPFCFRIVECERCVHGHGDGDSASFVIRHSSFVIRLSTFVFRHSSFVIRHSSFVIRHSSVVIRHSSFVIRHSSFVFRLSSFVHVHVRDPLLVPDPERARARARARETGDGRRETGDGRRETSDLGHGC